MVSKNFVLLAAAMQLPLSMWLQGCKKDKKTDGGKDGKKPAGDQTQPSQRISSKTTEPAQNQEFDYQMDQVNAVQLMNQLFQNEKVSFATRANIFQSKSEDNKKVSATILPIVQPDYKNNQGAGFANVNEDRGVTFTQLQEEFKQPRNNAIGQIAPYEFFLPMVVNPEIASPYTQFSTDPVLFNGKRHARGAAAESVFITGLTVPGAQNQIVNGVQKPSQQLYIVTEIYHSVSMKTSFPRMNPRNLMAVFMPIYDDLKFFQDICRRTFWTVIFANHAMQMDSDATQKQLFVDMHADNKKINGKTVSKINAWSHAVTTRAAGAVGPALVNEIRFLDTVGSVQPGTEYRNIDSMETMRQELEHLVSQVKRAVESRMHLEGHLVPFSGPFPAGSFADVNGAVVPWNLADEKHFEAMLGYTIYRDPSLSDKLMDIKMRLRWFLQDNTEWHSHTAADFTNANLRYVGNAPRTAPSASGHDYVTMCSGAYQGIMIHDMNFNALTEFPVIEREIATVAAGVTTNYPMCFPSMWLKRFFQTTKQVVPAANECYSEFALAVNQRNDGVNDNFFAPKSDDSMTLSKYMVNRMVVVHPGIGANEVFARIMLLSFYSAFEHSKSMYAYNEMSNAFTLGDQANMYGNQMVNNGWGPNQNNLYKRSTPFKKEFLVDELVFLTLKEQIEDGAKSFEDIANEIREKVVVVNTVTKDKKKPEQIDPKQIASQRLYAFDQ